MSNILAEINAKEIKKLVRKDTIALLIFGACENHGNHMPFGSDFITPFELAKRVASKYRNLIILPPVPYGVSSHHKDFFMTISLEPKTMIEVVRDLLISVVSNGIRRILIINGHDGNIAPIELAARSVKEKNPDVVIACLESWWQLVGKALGKTLKSWQGLGHGGEAETSAMLALRPDLVNIKNAPKTIIPKLPEDVRIYWKFKELSDTGATGAPRRASKEKGEKIAKVLEDTILSFIRKMDKDGWKYGISLK
ncbi:MAG: creatininase family protein [Nitrososphaerales archaeon]